MPRLILSTILLTSVMLPAAAADLPGYDRIDLSLDHRSRLVSASIWYPAAGPTYRVPVGGGPIFEPTPAYVGPAVAAGRHPLVLVSHGSGGNADSLGWLSTELVGHGAIVLAVNHPGSTSGDSSPRRSADLVSRARDLSAALDAVLADPFFADRVDTDRLGVVGFSLGGATALGLAGLRFDGAAHDANCSAKPGAADCTFFLRGGVRFADVPGFSGDARDPRVSRAVVIDPGFGGAVDGTSLAAVDASVTLINLGEAGRMAAADIGPNGNGLAGRLPDAAYSVVAPAVHFTFLGLCRPGAADILAEEGDDPICTDPAGVDREEVHARLAGMIAHGLGLDGGD